MRKPEDWLDEQIGDRPEDFSEEDIEKAMLWIGRIQRDARNSVIHTMLWVMACVLVGMAIDLVFR